MHLALLALLASTATAEPITAASSPAPPVTPQTAADLVGKVVMVKAASVVVDIGKAQGIYEGSRLQLFRTVRIDLGAGEVTEREDSVAVGVVTAAAANRAEVLLGLNEVVPEGARARPTTQGLSASRTIPARMTGVWEVSALLRPYVGLGEGGVAAQMEFAAGRRMGNLHLQARVLPLGLGFSSGDTSVIGAGYFLVSYDTELFEVGMGPGYTTIEDSNVTQHTGAALSQVLRVGSVDGINFSLLNAFYYGTKFEYAGTDGSIQAPVGEHLWLITRLGGSVAGYVEGELGLRILTSGNGGAGSLFLTPSLGGATQWHVPSSRCFGNQCFAPDLTATEHLSGPTVGLGAEWRL